jgi:hypothetical protein
VPIVQKRRKEVSAETTARLVNAITCAILSCVSTNDQSKTHSDLPLWSELSKINKSTIAS